MKTLIVGGVAGGATAAARLRRLDENHEIVLFERGGFISYANCGLPYFIGDEIKNQESLTLSTPESFRARYNIDVRIFHEVQKINRKNKSLSVKNKLTGEIYTVTYDKLILSPGAAPYTPQLSKKRSSRIFTLRDVPDSLAIKKFIQKKNPKSAVIAGGGPIGLEMAENLKRAGLDITIVELSNQVIAPIDFDMATAVHAHLREKGVLLLLGTSVNEVREENKKLKVTLDQIEIETDLLLISIGIRPESKLAKQSRIDINGRGFITTDGRDRKSVV
jgi:NADPH-dependent 2,4-dienoyl-CoA reductase/sulfur reductase-like enzyme